MNKYRNLMARVGGSLLLAGVFVVASTANAEAALTLRLTQGANVVTVADGDLADTCGSADCVTFNGVVGVFDLNVSTGVTNANTANFAEMDLNSINRSTAAGTLVIELSDDDFVPAVPGTLTGGVGGTTNSGTSVLSFEAYKNDSNVLFDTSSPEADIHITPPLQSNGVFLFAGSDSDSHGALPTYSMTLVATITHTGAALTSFDFNVQNVPEPASLALFGIGLLGAGFAARRRRSVR